MKKWNDSLLRLQTPWSFSLVFPSREKVTPAERLNKYILFFSNAQLGLLLYFCLGLISPHRNFKTIPIQLRWIKTTLKSLFWDFRRLFLPQTPDQYFWKSSTLKGTPSFTNKGGQQKILDKKIKRHWAVSRWYSLSYFIRYLARTTFLIDLKMAHFVIKLLVQPPLVLELYLLLMFNISLCIVTLFWQVIAERDQEI